MYLLSNENQGVYEIDLGGTDKIDSKSNLGLKHLFTLEYSPSSACMSDCGKFLAVAITNGSIAFYKTADLRKGNCYKYCEFKLKGTGMIDDITFLGSES